MFSIYRHLSYLTIYNPRVESYKKKHHLDFIRDYYVFEVLNKKNSKIIAQKFQQNILPKMMSPKIKVNLYSITISNLHET